MAARIVNGFFSTVGQAVRTLSTRYVKFKAYRTTGRLDVYQ